MQNLYDFSQIYSLQNKHKAFVALAVVLSLLFCGAVAVAVVFLHANTWLCVGVCLAILLVGYFCVGVLLAVPLCRLKTYEHFLADMQQGNVIQSLGTIAQIGQTTQKHGLQMMQIVVQQGATQRVLLVEHSVCLPFVVGQTYHIFTVGDCIVAVCAYEN